MVRNGWYYCPVCKRKVQKIEPDSIVFETPLYCRSCKLDFYPTIYHGRELDDDEPFPLTGRVNDR